jgi:hypothetical protein
MVLFNQFYSYSVRKKDIGSVYSLHKYHAAHSLDGDYFEGSYKALELQELAEEYHRTGLLALAFGVATVLVPISGITLLFVTYFYRIEE